MGNEDSSLEGLDVKGQSRVLVTGVNGFIGRHCVPLLRDAGYEIHAVGRQKRTGFDGVCWHEADLFDLESLDYIMAAVQPSHLLHLAWITTPGLYWTATANRDWTRTSVQLIDMFGARGGQRVAVAGTCAEYDWHYGWCVEGETPLEPASIYGACKLGLFVKASEVCRRYEMSLGWGRIFFPFGPGESSKRLVGSICSELLNGHVAKSTLGFQVRDFLYVEDVAGALVSLLGSDCTDAVNIGSGRPVPVREVVLRIAGQLGCGDRVELGSFRSQDEEIPLVAASTARLQSRIGWRPTYSLDEGLERTVGWWRDQVENSSLAPVA